MQRSACLTDERGGGTLSSLLVLETPDLSPYEMMSVSDGQVTRARNTPGHNTTHDMSPPPSPMHGRFG